MNLFCFSSTSLTNIWAGVGAGLWAVSKIDDMKARITKSGRLDVGSFGLIYCSETSSFTTPFVVLSKPDTGRIVSNIWPESWALPFRIHPLGNPHRQLHVDQAKSKWRVLSSLGQGGVTAAMNLTGTTVFVPKEVQSEDWTKILEDLATV